MSKYIFWEPGITLEQIEKQVIIAALNYFNGNKTYVAKALGISIRGLRNKVHQFQLHEFKRVKKWKLKKY